MMSLAFILYHLPNVLLVVIACWLGLSLLVRAPRDTTTYIFAAFSLSLVCYALTDLLAQLTTAPTVAAAFQRLHLAATSVAPGVFLHFIAILTSRGLIDRTRYVAIGLCYALGIALGAYALLGPLPAPTQPFPPWSVWGEPHFPAGPLTWAWWLIRVVPLIGALGMLALAYRHAPNDLQERQLRTIFAITSLIGVIGALAAVLMRELITLPTLAGIAAPALAVAAALPRTLMMVAMAALAYGVLMHRALLPARVARRTFFYSLLGSLMVAIYTGLVLLLEGLVRAWLSINVPIVTVVLLVVLIATMEPLREWVRARLDQQLYRREFDYVNLVRNLGNDLLEQGDLNDQLQAALSALCRALGVRAGLVVVANPGGLTLAARYGQVEPLPDIARLDVPDEPSWINPDPGPPWEPWPQAALVFPLRRGEDRQGLLLLGQQHIPKPYSASEHALLDYFHSYMSMAIHYAHARDLQQDVIVALAEQSRHLREQQEYLAQQANQATRPETSRQPTQGGSQLGLHVYALGPLYVEREGDTIARWGGTKAGTHQAEALFAFLFDRRGKGITKDEAAAIIWPDLEIDKADSAFHRTLAALRRTLEPGLRRGNLSQTILYHHERYWLKPEFISWCDSDAFLSAAERGLSQLNQGHTEQAVLTLEYANDLYRGDYMDDCPFFGDSAHVEDRRAELQARAVDVQLALGTGYEALGHVGEAASAYRRADALSPTGCPGAQQAIERLQVVA